MHAKDYGRISFWLATYAAFFALSAWAPFHWPKQARHVAGRPDPNMELHLCGLALQPPPRLTSDWIDQWGVREALNVGRVSVQPSLPSPRLANMAPYAQEQSEEVCQPVEQVAARPAAVLPPPAAPLSPAELEPVQTAPPAPMGSRWERPVALVEQLQALKAYDEAAPWAAAALEAIEHLTGADALAIADRQSKLVQLQKVLAEADVLAEQIEGHSLATLMRRAQYALERRTAVWQAVNQMELRGAAEPQLIEAEPERLSLCLADVMDATEGGVGSNWREYLLVESLSDLARQHDGMDRTQSRLLALRVLERLAHAKAMLPQASFVGEGPLAALDRELRYWAAEPVDATQLLGRLEEFEQSGLVSIGRLVAAQSRHLSFSPLAEDRQLSDQIDLHYRNCNLRISVSEAMFNQLLPKQKPTTSPVRDVVLGLPVQGRKTTETQLAVRLLPGSQRLRLELEATGLVDASTHSDSGPATVYTLSHSHYTARKVLEFTERGVVSAPAVSTAESQSRLRCIETDLDVVPLVGSLVGSYAKDQYEARREQARQEIQAKVEHQAKERIDSLAEARFDSLHQRFTERVMVPLDRLQLRPSLVEAVTIDDRFTMRVRLAGPHQLAAHTPRPRAFSDSLMSVQMHESAINNIVDQLQLAGQTMTVSQLREMIAAKLNMPGLLKSDSTNDDSELTFAERDPLSIRCREGRVELSVALARLQSGSRHWRNFTVHVSYRPQMNGRTVELLRDGSIGLAAERLSLQSQLVLRGTFSRIFSDDRRFPLFAEEFSTDPRLSDLQITQCVIDDGWIGLAIGPARATAALPAMAR
jgi:hypothetical protein